MSTKRHTTETVAEARRLHEAGFTVYRIALILRRRGTPVDQTTVAEWVDPQLAERRRKEQRERMRRLNAKRTGGRLGAGPPRSPEFKLERMRSLAAAGVSCAAIAKVMTFDFPDTPLDRSHVEYALRCGGMPRAFRKAAA